LFIDSFLRITTCTYPITQFDPALNIHISERRTSRLAAYFLQDNESNLTKMSPNPIHPYVEDYFSDDEIEQEGATPCDEDDRDFASPPSPYGVPDHASDSGYSSNYSHIDGSEKDDYASSATEYVEFDENLARQNRTRVKPHHPPGFFHARRQIYQQAAPPQQYFCYPPRAPFGPIRPPQPPPQQPMQYRPPFNRPLYLQPPYYRTYHPIPIPVPIAYPATSHRYSYPMPSRPPPAVFYSNTIPMTRPTAMSYAPLQYPGDNGMYHPASAPPTSRVPHPPQSVNSPLHYAESIYSGHGADGDSRITGYTEKPRSRPKTWPATTREVEREKTPRHERHWRRKEEEEEQEDVEGEQQVPDGNTSLKSHPHCPAHPDHSQQTVDVLHCAEDKTERGVNETDTRQEAMECQSAGRQPRPSRPPTRTALRKTRSSFEEKDDLGYSKPDTAYSDASCEFGSRPTVRHPAPTSTSTSATVRDGVRARLVGTRGCGYGFGLESSTASTVDDSNGSVIEERIRRRYAFVYT